MRLSIFSIFILIIICLVQINEALGQIEVIPIAENKLSVKNISQGRIKALVEDKRGIMWIGTLDGLNSFDGYKTTIYRHLSNDSSSISNNIINSLDIDTNGCIWVATNMGLNRFSPITKKFKLFLEEDYSFDRLNANKINEIDIDNEGNIWMATGGAGIIKLNPTANKREYITLNINSSSSLNQIMLHLTIDDNNDIWFSNTKGEIGRINSVSNEIEIFDVKGTENNKLFAFWANNIYCDDYGKVWFTLTGLNNGLYYYDEEKNKIVEAIEINNQLRKEYRYLGSLYSFSSMVNDIDGNLWVSSVYRGLFKIDKNNHITAYIDLPIENISNYTQFNETGALVLYWGSNGILWKGTNGYGLEYIVDFNFFFNTVSNNGYYSGYDLKSVRAFEEDDKYLWISGYGNLIRFDKKTKKYTMASEATAYYSMCNNPQKPDELILGSEGGGIYVFNKVTADLKMETFDKSDSKNEILGINVYELANQGDSIIWIGRNSGLEKFKVKTGESEKIKIIHPSPDIINSVSIICSLIEKDGKVWFGSMANGIWEYDAVDNILKRKMIKIENGVNQPQRINSIYRDSKNIIWICTDNGVYSSSNWNDDFSFISSVHGLSNNFVYASLEDDYGNIWFSTNNGLSKYNTSDSLFINYYLSDGIQDNEFNTGAYFKDKDGYLYFGGINGFTYFKPNDKQKKFKLLSLVLTEAYTNLGDLRINENILVLKKETDFLNIEFSLLSFLTEKQNIYQYRNLNNDTNWIDLGNRNSILFDKPVAGIQNIEIRARVLGTEWNKNILKIKLIKAPYLWETWLFWVLIILFSIFLIFLFVKRKIRKSKIEKRNLEILVENKTSELKLALEEVRETNAAKDKLFSIIAHDLRNPLNSLLGFSSLLMNNANEFSEEEKNEFISIIFYSSKNLNSLLDNLLNWSRLQLNKINPHFSEFNIKDIVNSNLEYLNVHITEKKIKLDIKNLENTMVFADPDMISVIVRNLISNAIKYSKTEGLIKISGKITDKQFFNLSICDNGIGMDNKTLTNIFSLNKEKSKKGTKNEIGSGLGLILCQDFAIINKCEILASSEIEKGSCFSVLIPRSE